MSLRLVYRRRVGRDLANAFAYYEEKVEGLGERFLGAVDSAFDAIERYPEMFAKVHRDVRRAIRSFRTRSSTASNPIASSSSGYCIPRDPRAWPLSRKAAR